MSPKKIVRRQLFVDLAVQGSLAFRSVLYWIVCLVTVLVALLFWQVMTGPPAPFEACIAAIWNHYGPAFVASLLVLPIVVLDIIRMSNRFVGPLVRLRRSLRALARGEHVEPLSFRQGDFWLELAQDFNAMLARVQREPREMEPRQEEPAQENHRELATAAAD